MLDVYPVELKAFYAGSGAASSPYFPVGWRQLSIPMQKKLATTSGDNEKTNWQIAGVAAGHYQIIGLDAQGWHYLKKITFSNVAANCPPIEIALSSHFTQIELLIDRRNEMTQTQH